MNKKDAIEIAKKECDRQGWLWREPVHVQWGIFCYKVLTHANARGGNAVIRIRKRDGTVVSSHLLTR